jgi:3-deoxy-manno-octulosonate cytidylyltransferase (CMP-KDO synthetase)
MTPVIFIPARLASTRLPGKPLAQIGGLPMIVQVARRASAAHIGPVYIACDGEEIKSAVEAHGFNAILTDPDLPSGSDRIFAALQTLDAPYDTIINVQGDMPTLDPSIVQHVTALLAGPAADIGTLAAPITDPAERDDPAVVKVVVSRESLVDSKTLTTGRALYFSRAPIPHGEGPLYHHIGIYAYRRAALGRFVMLPPSPLEKREKLEQLRALEAGMRIDVAVVDTVPLGVDTPEGLEKARLILRNA